MKKLVITIAGLIISIGSSMAFASENYSDNGKSCPNAIRLDINAKSQVSKSQANGSASTGIRK